MDDEFKQLYHCQWDIDPVFECFVEAWMAYHRAADEVEGDLPIWDRSLTRLAVRAGNSAMEMYLRDINLTPPSYHDNKEVWKDWQRAKLIALRRLDNERRQKNTHSALLR